MKQLIDVLIHDLHKGSILPLNLAFLYIRLSKSFWIYNLNVKSLYLLISMYTDVKKSYEKKAKLLLKTIRNEYKYFGMISDI